jgi:molybdopterin-guanine dinucleotide biosynthesis protein A
VCFGSVYDHRVNDPTGFDVVAFILAGGKSTRMGSDKAFLEVEGEILLSRVLKLANAVTRGVRIVGDPKNFAAYGPVIEDVYRDRGPLGGIHAALRSSPAELNLMLAVDLPFLESRFLEYLILQAQESGAVVTVPRMGGRWQPLCAVYRRVFLEVVERSLNEGKNKIDSLFPSVQTRVVDEAELIRAGFTVEKFRNLNTPEELEIAKAYLSQRSRLK